MKRLSIALFVFVLTLSGCSSTPEPAEKKADTQVAKSTEVNKVKPAPVKKAVKPKKKKPESTVEVIPRKETSQPDLILEPLPVEKSTGSEDGTTTTASSAESASIPDAVQSQPPVDVPEDASQPTEQAPDSPPSAAKSSKAVKVKTKTVVEKGSTQSTFTVTAGPKVPAHPFYGKGHDRGFYVDGVPGKELVLQRGKTYKLVIKTNPKHDVYISTKAIGWGSTAWTEGVQGMYTYRGTITFTPDKNTPNVLYYSCRNHPYMGGRIDIVNPGQSITIKRPVYVPGQMKAVVQAEPVTRTQVSQKLMFADMVTKSKAFKQVSISGMKDAMALQAKGQHLIVQAKQKQKSGDLKGAYTDLDKALAMLNKASSMVPSENELQQLKAHHEELQASIKDFAKSHADNAERIRKAKGDSAVVDYDKKEVERLKFESEQHVKSGDYAGANQLLEKAQHLITVALKQMLQSQTIVYDLKFKTPKDEYEYELKRYGGYEELIPVAIEAKKPTEGAKKLMQSYLDKSHSMRDAAKKKAAAGDYPVAIRMMQDATKTVRLALRMVGVSQ